MQYLNQEIENELKNQGAELIRFVNISHLDEKQNRQLPPAIVTISTMMNIRKPNIKPEK